MGIWVDDKGFDWLPNGFEDEPPNGFEDLEPPVKGLGDTDFCVDASGLGDKLSAFFVWMIGSLCTGACWGLGGYGFFAVFFGNGSSSSSEPPNNPFFFYAGFDATFVETGYFLAFYSSSESSNNPFLLFVYLETGFEGFCGFSSSESPNSPFLDLVYLPAFVTGFGTYF